MHRLWKRAPLQKKKKRVEGPHNHEHAVGLEVSKWFQAKMVTQEAIIKHTEVYFTQSYIQDEIENAPKF